MLFQKHKKIMSSIFSKLPIDVFDTFFEFAPNEVIHLLNSKQRQYQNIQEHINKQKTIFIKKKLKEQFLPKTFVSEIVFVFNYKSISSNSPITIFIVPNNNEIKLYLEEYNIPKLCDNFYYSELDYSAIYDLTLISGSDVYYNEYGFMMLITIKYYILTGKIPQKTPNKEETNQLFNITIDIIKGLDITFCNFVFSYDKCSNSTVLCMCYKYDLDSNDGIYLDKLIKIDDSIFYYKDALETFPLKKRDIDIKIYDLSVLFDEWL